MPSDASEGVIKFKYTLKPTADLEESEFLGLEKWRAIFHKMGLVGEYLSEQVGFGNLSKRMSNNNQFIITGTQTGKYAHLNGSQYTKVLECDLKKMTLKAAGPIAPSSESVTHYSIYEQSPQIKAIFHIHHDDLWEFMKKNDYDSSPADIEYGTEEMAQACKKIINTKSSGIIVMLGHQSGIISYGTTTEEAGKIILETLKESRK